MRSILFLSLASLLMISTAEAQYNEAGVSRSTPSMNYYGNSIQEGFAGYLAAGAGYSDNNSNLNVEGAPTSLKLLASYMTEAHIAVFDVGYGIQNHAFSNYAAVDSSISVGVMELAARYQFNNLWQLGGLYNQFFNTGSNYGANQADVEFIGVQLLKEFNIGSTYLARVGGRIMTSINVNNASINMAVIDFQIGWGGSNSRSVSSVSVN